MMKNKTFLISVATLLLSFNLNSASFAIVDVSPQDRCPDYSYEFTGKDKCERFNRKMFRFNARVNKYVIKPVNIVWASVMPKYGIERVQNFYTNLEFPIRLAGCLFQKDFKASRQETVRFLTNTTLGVGGLYDPAKDRFKIEPRNEDMEQVLAHCKVKQGPYVVLPIIASGNVRDLVGQLLDCPLNPTSYVIGPVALVAKTISVVNKTTNMQSLLNAINSSYADPYEITKKLQGVDKYIKNKNLDRKEVLAERTRSQNLIKVNTITDGATPEININNNLKADIGLNNYNPQSPVIDSMRTALFDDPSLCQSKWAEMSVWNRDFNKKIKTSSVNIDKKHPDYKYRYILQKDKTAPLAILYPSIGEGVNSYHSIVLAKTLFDEGYSVVIQGSAFQWEFVASMPDGYRPGMPAQDARYLRTVTAKILDNIKSKKECQIASKKAPIFGKKLLVGTSFGALTTLFVANQEENENTLGISNYISINPPIEILFALAQVDKFSQDWKNNPNDIKMRAAITAEKVLQVTQNVSDKKSRALTKKSTDPTNVSLAQTETLPFTDEEAKLILGFIMQQKLSDVVFTVENASPKGVHNCSNNKKCDLYEEINKMDYYDYAKKYLAINDYKSVEQLNYDTSLYSIANFLQNSKNYKIYHSIDDYFVNPEQLIWLKKQTKDKSVFFSNGSHLGFLYRKEFMDEFKKDTNLQTSNVQPQPKPCLF